MKDLTKREYFAGCALQAFIVAGKRKPLDVLPEDIASEAVYYADLLIDALEDPPIPRRRINEPGQS